MDWLNAERKKDADLDAAYVQTLAQYASFFHNSVAGPQIMADLKKMLDRPTYRPGRSNDEVLWREGRRSVYLDIVSAIGAGIEAIESLSSERPTHAEGVGSTGDPLE